MSQPKLASHNSQTVLNHPQPFLQPNQPMNNQHYGIMGQYQQHPNHLGHGYHGFGNYQHQNMAYQRSYTPQNANQHMHNQPGSYHPHMNFK